MKDLPIGVFDSGIGGLTVLREVFRELPFESTIYLGDTARVPYGIRSPQTVTRYTLEGMRFLTKKGIKLLIIACNTASSVSLLALRKNCPVPVIGVVELGARAALKNSRNKKIGVIGTEATIRSGSYIKAIKAIDGKAEIFSLACPLFVPLAEEGWVEGDIAELIAKAYLIGFKNKGIDTLLLGCTHYPLLKVTLSKVMGNGIALIDSGKEAAKEIRHVLQKHGIYESRKRKPLREFYVTDSPERFREIGERFLGEPLKEIKLVSLEEG